MTLRIGAALGTVETHATGVAPGWLEIKQASLDLERHGFDTVWIADELLWELPDAEEPSGWWECVSLLGAVAAVTSTIEVGSWVLSALHRNPGLTAKIVETVDEISQGRFIFGFGAGHAGRQGEAFGYPPDLTVTRYVEALEIIVELIRRGSSSHTGRFHSSTGLRHRPRGPQWPKIPLMLGGHGPRTIAIAVEHADIWSAYATESSTASAFSEMMNSVDAACEAAGRDPRTLGRSVGIDIWPTDIDVERPASPIFGPPFEGSSDECVAELRRFGDLGFNRIEIMMPADDSEVIEAFAPIVAAAKAT